MTKKHYAIESMAETVVAFVLTQESITAKLPGFAGYLAEVQKILLRIRELSAVQAPDLHGYIESKDKARAVLVKCIIEIIRSIRAYCVNVDDPILLAEVKYSESVLMKMKDEKLTGVCQSIHDKVSSRLSELAEYHITATTIGELQKYIDEFIIVMPKDREAVVAHDKVTKEISSLFEMLMKLLQKMDVLVDMVRTKEVNFFNEYKKAREVIVKGRRTILLRVIVSGEHTAQPIQGASLELIPTVDPLSESGLPGRRRISKKTGSGGASYFIGASPGGYVLKLSKYGYKDSSVDVYLNEGEGQKLFLTMKEV